MSFICDLLPSPNFLLPNDQCLILFISLDFPPPFLYPSLFTFFFGNLVFVGCVCKYDNGLSRAAPTV